MKISVVMPFYNCERYLDDSIQSILNQTFDDFEFIIINDGSTDNSDGIVSKYLDDKRIVYIKNEKNQGIVKNLNHGISIARGEYVARMDGDDISLIDRFKKQLNYLEKNKDISFVGSWAHIINEDDIKIGELKKPLNFIDIHRDIFLYSCFIHPTIMIRRSVFVANNIYYREKYLYCEDYDMWMRLIYGGFRGENIGECLLRYRKHKNSSNKNSKIIAIRNLSLRKDVIGSFQLHLNLLQIIGMYVHYLSGILLSGDKKEILDAFLKRMVRRCNMTLNFK